MGVLFILGGFLGLHMLYTLCCYPLDSAICIWMNWCLMNNLSVQTTERGLIWIMRNIGTGDSVRA